MFVAANAIVFLVLAYLPRKRMFKNILIFIVCLNIPVFHVIGYFNKLLPDLATLPFIDF